ncbi:MAG: hypothetical protein DYH17_04655 [Xanthomonadales bacterium PRO6]|nr:hypothetical protein [Xanthomonadales bacterium]MCE7930647.1 hypothetical protein [Xanthomonadales bacterium PRO6]
MNGRYVASAPGHALRASLLLLAAWLLWSLGCVNVDLDDGYATISNAQYFLGLSDFYAFVRGPLMGLALMPSELLSEAMGAGALDVRPHHLTMVLLHFGYLLGCWWLLRREQPCDWPTVLAFLAAIPTTLFFGYAPLISHDLFPGLMALALVWQTHRFAQAPRAGRWCALVCLGAALPLLKQSYALVWIAVLLAESILAASAPGHRWRTLGALSAAALVSALLTWVGYALVLSRDFADVPFWLRPWELILLLSRIYDQEGGNLAVFFQGVYLRNLWACGVLAMALALPGAALALLRGTSWMRRVALVWLLLAVALWLTPLKELRYLAVLAPFHALLIVDALRLAWNRWPVARAAMLVALVCELGLRLPEAVRIAHPWYATAVTDYFAPLPDGADFGGTLYMGIPQAFVAPDSSAFFGDRYHRITHFSIENLVALKRIPVARARKLRPGEMPSVAAIAPGDYWVMANKFVARAAPFVAGNRSGLQQDFQQFLAVAEWLELEREDGRFVVLGEHAGDPHLLLGPASALAGPGSFDLAQIRASGLDGDADRLRVLGFRVLRLCDLEACRSY